MEDSPNCSNPPTSYLVTTRAGPSVYWAPTSFTPRTEPLSHGGGPTHAHQPVRGKLAQHRSLEGGGDGSRERRQGPAQIGGGNERLEQRCSKICHPGQSLLPARNTARGLAPYFGRIGTGSSGTRWK